jgi:hypothetical protein
MKKDIKNLLNEGIINLYETKLTKSVGEGPNTLVKLFREYNKLTLDLIEDTLYIEEFYNLLKEDDFDPFSHLQGTGKIDDENDCVLSISKPNDKLGQINAASLALPAGYTCPFADKCKSLVNRSGEKFKHGTNIKDFGDTRCFAASGESRLPNVRNSRWRNFDLLKDTYTDKGINGMTDLLVKSIRYYESNEGKLRLFRIHDSGDFYSQEYFDAWISAAKAMPDILFYAYTKSLPFWGDRKNEIPRNLRLIASEGGKADEMISKEGFRKAVIVKDTGEAIKRKLNIDVNDFLAAFGENDFALLLHGIQSKSGGNNSQAIKNSKIIKFVASKFNTTPQEIDRLLSYYTN